jgi:hypothetical protein
LWANEHVQGKHEQAELLYQHTLIIYEKTLGPEHPETAAILYCLAFLCQQQERKPSPSISVRWRSMSTPSHLTIPLLVASWVTMPRCSAG